MDFDVEMDLNCNSREIICHKIKHQTYEPLKFVKKCPSVCKFIGLWNRFQVVIYSNYNFDIMLHLFIADFLIVDVLVTDKILLCLDNKGIVYLTHLKIKNPSKDSPIKPKYITWMDGVVGINFCNDNYVTVLLNKNGLYVGLYKIESSLKLVKNFKLNQSSIDMLNANILFDSHVFTGDELLSITDNILNIAYSLDGHSVYYIVKKIKMSEDWTLPRLIYRSNVEILSINITKDIITNVEIALRIGSVINIHFQENDVLKTYAHLNISIDKIIHLKDETLVYGDGITLWIARKPFKSNTCIGISQVNDVLVSQNVFLCITYTSLIYRLDVEKLSQKFYEKLGDDDFISLPSNLLRCKKVYKKLSRQINENSKITRNIQKEKNILQAIVLTQKAHLLKEASFSTNALILDSIKDITILEEKPILTKPKSDYLNPENQLLFLRFSCLDLLSKTEYFKGFFSDAQKLHYCITVKTSSSNQTFLVPLNSNFLGKFNVLLPLNKQQFFTPFYIYSKLVCPVPGVPNDKDVFWVIWPCNATQINPRNAITFTSNTNILYDTQANSIENHIDNLAEKHGGSIYDIELNSSDSRDHIYFLDLKTTDIESLMNCEDKLGECLSKSVAKKLGDTFKSKGFLSGSEAAELSINNHQVRLQIVNNKLKIYGKNLTTVCDIRHFVADLISTNTVIEKRYIPLTFLVETQSLLEELNKKMNYGNFGMSEIMMIAQDFEIIIENVFF